MNTCFDETNPHGFERIRVDIGRKGQSCGHLSDLISLTLKKQSMLHPTALSNCDFLQHNTGGITFLHNYNLTGSTTPSLN